MYPIRLAKIAVLRNIQNGFYVTHYQDGARYYIISQNVLHYQAASLLYYRVMVAIDGFAFASDYLIFTPFLCVWTRSRFMS